MIELAGFFNGSTGFLPRFKRVYSPKGSVKEFARKYAQLISRNYTAKQHTAWKGFILRIIHAIAQYFRNDFFDFWLLF